MQQIGAELGRNAVGAAMVTYGYAALPAAEADKLIAVLGLPADVKPVLMAAPYRLPAQPWPPTDPFVYRFYEMVMLYGPVFKDVSHEIFGDGIISAIDCSFDIKKVVEEGVNRAVFTLESLMESLSECPSPDAPRRKLLTIIQEVERISEELRRISFDLMPSMLEPLGLHQTMEWMAGHFASLYGLNVYYEAHGLGQKRLPPELEVSLFRVFQEGLNNIVKHAQASRVHLNLVYNHPKVIVIISDDGRGFTPESDRRSGLGLRSMEQRVAQMGGTIRIRSQPGAGSTIRVEIPLKNHVPKHKYEENRYIRR